MKWLAIDYDGNGILGIPTHYMTEVIPELIEKERMEYENARSR